MPAPKKKVGRPKKVERIPFGARRSKLHVKDQIKGYVLRWVNDQDNRLMEAQEGGYEFVDRKEVPRLGGGQIHQENTDLNSRVSKVVSRGEPVIRAYLMKIKEAWYREDQETKEREGPALVDEALRQGKPGGNVVENQYVPEGHTQQI